jgi:hypothetical protein
VEVETSLAIVADRRGDGSDEAALTARIGTIGSSAEHEERAETSWKFLRTAIHDLPFDVRYGPESSGDRS